MLSKEDLSLIEKTPGLRRKKFYPDLEEIDYFIEDLMMSIPPISREEAISKWIRWKEEKQTKIRLQALVEIDYLEQEARFLQSLLSQKEVR